MAERTDKVWLTVSHSDFEATENRFVLRFVVPHLLVEDPKIREEEMPTFESRLRDETTRDETIEELIEKVGPDVLAPSRLLFDVMKDREGSRARIRELVHARIRDCYEAARWAEDAKDRQAAHEFFERFARALAGPRRRQRAGALLDRGPVREFYYRRLFRLRQARNLMAVPVSCDLDKKIAAVAEACGLEQGELRDYFLTGKGLRRRPISIELQARLWTGRQFGIKQQAVANLMTVFKGRSSKSA